MTGQQLRNSILQEAIQGRLVPNILQPGEKTGAELLQDILAERQKKENEEKGKKAKKLTLSSIEEEPWELPEGWCWCKLPEMCEIQFGTRVVKKDDEGSTYYVYGGGGATFMVDAYNRENALLVSRFAMSKQCTRFVEGKFFLNDSGLSLQADGVNLLQPFLNYLIFAFNDTIYMMGRGAAQKNLNMDEFVELTLPFPPLSIQQAIVAKIEELLPLVDEYDKAAGELKALNETLPDKLRKSVLQEAIHGNLVPNDIPEGEAAASELLQQILKERQDRENKEKGKKAKKLTLSTIEEEPWELPEGWCWCKIDDIFDHSAGKSLNSSKQSVGKVYPYLTTSNVYWDGIVFDKVKEMPFTKEEYEKSSAIKNDILVCEGGDVGRSCIWTYDYTIGLQNHVHRLRSIKNTDVKFYYYVLRLYKATNIITAKGIGIGGFSANALKGLTVPLPPLSIQHRIVEKIEELFSAINTL